jgi:hypothetical protein
LLVLMTRLVLNLHTAYSDVGGTGGVILHNLKQASSAIGVVGLSH